MDAWFNTDLRTMIGIWMGDLNYKQAIRSKALLLVDPSRLTHDVESWMANSIFAHVRPAQEIM